MDVEEGLQFSRILVALGGVVCSVILIINIATIVALFKSRSSTPSRILLFNTCISDLLVGLAAVYYAATTFLTFNGNVKKMQESRPSMEVTTDPVGIADINPPMGISDINPSVGIADINPSVTYLCLGALFALHIGVFGSVLAVVAMTVDRFVAVVYPLRYNTLVTTARVKVIICGAWIYDLTICSYVLWSEPTLHRKMTECQSLTWLDRRYYLGLYMGFVLVFAAIISILYIRVVSVALSHRRRISAEAKILQRLPKRASQTASSITVVDIVDHQPPEETDTSQMSHVNVDQTDRGQWRVTIMFMILIGTFYMCWTPYITMTVYLNFIEHNPPDGVLHAVYTITKIITVFNSLANPCIYAWKDKELRHILRKLMPNCHRDQI